MRIEVPDHAVEALDAARLPFGWQDAVGFTRAIVDQWLAQARSPVLAVPSAVLPDSTNLLIDPAHPRAGEIRVRDTQPFRFDPRLRPERRTGM